MKRFVAILAVEGYTTKDGRRIERGGIKITDVVPVVRRNEVSFDTQPVGIIDTIYRVGAIVVGKGWWTEPLEDYTPGEVLEIVLSEVDVEWTNDGNALSMTTGRLASAKVGTNPSFPQASIIFLEDE